MTTAAAWVAAIRKWVPGSEALIENVVAEVAASSPAPLGEVEAAAVAVLQKAVAEWNALGPCKGGENVSEHMAAALADAGLLTVRLSTSGDTALREAVEALAAEWEATVYKWSPAMPMTVNEFCAHWFKRPLRALLNPTPPTDTGGVTT